MRNQNKKVKEVEDKTKFCKDCKWVEKDDDFDESMICGYPKNLKEISLSTGRSINTEYCDKMREEDCGRNAKWFEPKEKGTKE